MVFGTQTFVSKSLVFNSAPYSIKDKCKQFRIMFSNNIYSSMNAQLSSDYLSCSVKVSPQVQKVLKVSINLNILIAVRCAIS